MPRLFLAARHSDRRPITDIFVHTPDIPATCQWCLFLRNPDELTLEMVSEEERRRLYHAYSSDPRMRLNLGIRRRLAPLLDNDRRKIELLTSLLFTLPGSPILYYGDEIGMGDNIYLGDRNGVRTPMQWTGDRNAGFSRADAARLYLPLNVDPVYGYQANNVEAQLRTPSSLLHWMKRLIAARKKTRVFGRGTLRFLRCPNDSVLAHVREFEGETVLAVHNLSGAAQPVELDLGPWIGHTPLEMLGETRFPAVRDQLYFVSMAPYGYYWFRLQPPRQETMLYGIEDVPL
jgi:maltose alpha-D-glucosyltransferase/alpha-amylase